MTPPSSRLEPAVDLAVAFVHRGGTAVVAGPAGHGRSEVVRRVAESCNAGVVAEPADVLSALSDPTPRAVAIDQLHRAEQRAVDLAAARALVGRDAGALVIGTADVEALRLSEAIVDGRVLLIELGEQVPFTDDPRLASAILRDAFERDVDEPARRLAAALVGLRIARRSIADAIEAAIGVPDAMRQLRRLPLVTVGDDVVEFDERWDFVATELSSFEERRLATIAAEGFLAAGDLAEAGRTALVGRSATVLRNVVRRSLDTQPPRVDAHHLREWSAAQLLPADDPHRRWLDTASHAARGAALRDTLTAYEQIRAEFADRGDVDAEISVGMAASIVARRLDDFAAIVHFAQRATELDRLGHRAARGPAQLGEALGLQMYGDPAAALRVLDSIAPDAFEGDWAAQLEMMRGTNLTLLGRLDDGIAAFVLATSTGSAWSHAVAFELLGHARWLAGQRWHAIRDIEQAERSARAASADRVADGLRLVRAAMLAAEGDELDLSTRPRAMNRDAPPSEFLIIARAFDAINHGNIDAARNEFRTLTPPTRATRPAFWIAALQTALDRDTDSYWAGLADQHASLRPAHRAGQIAAAHLAGGPLAPAAARAFLPSSWCEPTPPHIEIQLLGAALVRANRQVVEHPYWERPRVRELCAYLALVDDSSRELAAERMWPDLSGDAATRNLRVTLSYLLDVLEPTRQKGTPSVLVDERNGRFRFADLDHLHIDARDLSRCAVEVLHLAERGREREAIAGARELVRFERGPLLGGAALGPWSDDYLRHRFEVTLRAVSVVGPLALEFGDHDLAEQLGELALSEDPWGERAHQLVIRAQLARDDLDAARRSLRRALRALDEIGARPERATLELARDLGVTRALGSPDARRSTLEP